MKFRLLPKVGDHAEAGPGGKAETFKAGGIVESDRDLVEAFVGKFERVEELEGSNPFKPSDKEKDAVKKAAEEGAKDVSAPEGEPEPNPLGRDVTKRFPMAEEEDFKVFSDGGAFSVVEEDDPTDALNTTPLKRKDVDSFIREYLET